METISIKLEENFAKDIEKTLKQHHYTTKTEFVREAIRDKIKHLEKEEAVLRLNKLYGASKLKTTDAMLHKAREEVVLELEKELQ